MDIMHISHGFEGDIPEYQRWDEGPDPLCQPMPKNQNDRASIID